MYVRMYSLKYTALVLAAGELIIITAKNHCTHWMKRFKV